MTDADLWIDTHCHLDSLDAPVEQWVNKAKDSGVGKIVTVGTDIPTSRRSVEIAGSFDEVWAVVGIHPHDSAAADGEALEEISALCKHPKVVAIGEVGLDYYRDYAPRDVQVAAFKAQLRLASDLGKAVVLHVRDSFEQTIDVLDEFALPAPLVFHCFSGDASQAAEAARKGFVSFAGNLTFKNAQSLREAAKVVPKGRLLIETDAPYLAPVPFRGRTNEPALVSVTGTALADVIGVDAPSLTRTLAVNSGAAFGWGG